LADTRLSRVVPAAPRADTASLAVLFVTFVGVSFSRPFVPLLVRHLGDGAPRCGPLVGGPDGPRTTECGGCIAWVGGARGSHQRLALTPEDGLGLCGPSYALGHGHRCLAVRRAPLIDRGAGRVYGRRDDPRACYAF